jgi:hypothetical protein
LSLKQAEGDVEWQEYQDAKEVNEEAVTEGE